MKKAAPKKPGLKILVIGDTHAEANERYEDWDRLPAVGKFIYQEKPDHIVHIGDVAEMVSLDGWKGSKMVGGAGGGRALEGKRLDADLTAFEDCLKAIKRHTDQQNARHVRSRRKDRLYTPGWHLTLGNHCERLDRVPEAIPQLSGLIGTHMLHEIAADLGWKSYPYLQEVEIAGIAFAHYFETGTSRNAAGVRQILGKQHRSCVWGHSHTFGFDQQARPPSQTISAVCVGNYKRPGRNKPFEWAGVVMLKDCHEGTFSVEQHSYESILEAHGEGDYAKRLRAARAQYEKERQAE